MTEQATFEMVRQIALALPGVEEAESHGTPGLKANKRFIGWLAEDRDTFIMRVDKMEREILLQAEPDIYHITDHYVPTCYVLVRVSKIHPADLRHHIERAWRSIALKRDIKAYDSR